MILLKEFFY